jgi:hypothetical protein
MGKPYNEVVISGVQASIYRCRALKIAEKPRALCFGMSDKRNNLAWELAGRAKPQNTAHSTTGSTDTNYKGAFWYALNVPVCF